jgi:aspartate kinase
VESPSTRAPPSQPPPGDSELTDGTIVRKFASRPPGTVVGIASEKDLFLLLADGRSDELFEFLDAQKVCGKQLHVASTGDNCSVAMVISRENLHDEDRFRSRLAEKFGSSVRLVDGIGAVSAIGAGINTSYKNLRVGSAAIAPVPVLGVSTSSFRITWLISAASVDTAVRALHQAFIEAMPHPVP